MSVSDDYYRPPPARVTPYALLVRLSPEDKALLAKLTHAKQATAADVVRDLLRAAGQGLEEV